MCESIERGGGEQWTLKQIGPFGERPVRRDDERAPFVPLIDHFVEIFGPGRRQRLEAEVVQDQHVRSRVGEQPALVGSIGSAAVEMAEHSRGGDKDDVEAAATGFVSERLRQVRFADAGGTLNKHGLVALHESARRQIEAAGGTCQEIA